jgi:Ribosomal protein L4
MKRDVLTINGKKDGDIELPNVFETEVNRTLIHKAYINLESHGFQKHSTKPTAGRK